LVGYCDADWASDLEDKRSTTWSIFMMGGGAISWSSKRQPTITLSMTKGEYVVNTQVNKETISMTKLMKESKYMKKNKAMVIRCDNQDAISLTNNPTQHVQTKHINDAPPNSWMDSTSSPKVKTTKRKGVGAHSLVHSTLGVEGR
jgi:hypothetical protein